MVEPNEQENRGRKESAANHPHDNHPVQRSIPGVDFEEMNFEQRRAPYNSGKRAISERDYDKSREEKDGGRTSHKP